MLLAACVFSEQPSLEAVGGDKKDGEVSRPVGQSLTPTERENHMWVRVLWKSLTYYSAFSVHVLYTSRHSPVHLEDEGWQDMGICWYQHCLPPWITPEAGISKFCSGSHWQGLTNQHCSCSRLLWVAPRKWKMQSISTTQSLLLIIFFYHKSLQAPMRAVSLITEVCAYL